MRKLILAQLLLLLVCCTSTGQAPVCPRCWNNQFHLVARHGYGGSGRQLVNIFIDTSTMGSLDSTTQQKIRDQLEDAVGQWNDAEDTTVSAGSWNRKIQYELATTTVASQADIIVRLGTPAVACASIDNSVYPHVITISTTVANLYDDALEGMFKHEIGHRLGLAHGSSGCTAEETIMTGASNLSTCLGGGQTVTFRDVKQSNNNFGNPSENCTETADTTSYGIDEVSPGGSPCDGDPCCGDPCCGGSCGGYDCYMIYDTYCYGCEAYEPYNPSECMWWGACYEYVSVYCVN